MSDNKDSYIPAIKEDEEQATPPVDHRMSEVSKRYDRGGKGYLDSKELMARQMDDGSGPNVERVISLLESLKQEQRTNMTMKKMLIALAIFAVLLSLANVGTAFAAAKLAKDIHTKGPVLVNDKGEVIHVAESHFQFLATDGEVDGAATRSLQDGTYTSTGSTLAKADLEAIVSLFDDHGADDVQIRHCEGHPGRTYTTLTALTYRTSEPIGNSGKTIDTYYFDSRYGRQITIESRSDRSECTLSGVHQCTDIPCAIDCGAAYTFCDTTGDRPVCDACGCVEPEPAVLCIPACSAPL